DAVPVRQRYVQHHHVPLSCAYLPDRFRTAIRFLDENGRIAFHQNLSQALADNGVVVNDQDVHGRYDSWVFDCVMTEASCPAVRGIDKRTVVPCPGATFTVSFPSRSPARSIMPRIPKELNLAVSDGSIPHPLSRTSSSNWP